MDVHNSEKDSARGHVHLIDDDKALRETFCRWLSNRGFEVTDYESGADFLTRHQSHFPAVIVLDMRMPTQSGLDILKSLRRGGIDTPVVFISGESTAPEAVSAMKLGAIDFIFKPAPLEYVLHAIEGAIAKNTQDRRSGLERANFIKRYETLTPRERDLCPYIARNDKNKTIAAALEISEPTVKIHKSRVLRKLGFSSGPELALALSKFRINETE
jgi:FixJ family two-component response regulator